MDKIVKTIYIRLKKPRWFDYPDQAYDYAKDTLDMIELLGIKHKIKLGYRPYYDPYEAKWIRK